MPGKVYECDNCGTMLEEGDPMLKVMGGKHDSTVFVYLRFCCQSCAEAFAKEHSQMGLGCIPVILDIDIVPNENNHEFIVMAPYDPSNEGERRREAWDTDDYEDASYDYNEEDGLEDEDPDQESCTWGNCHGVDDDEGYTEDYDDWDEEEPD